MSFKKASPRAIVPLLPLSSPPLQQCKLSSPRSISPKAISRSPPTTTKSLKHSTWLDPTAFLDCQKTRNRRKSLGPPEPKKFSKTTTKAEMTANDFGEVRNVRETHDEINLIKKSHSSNFETLSSSSDSVQVVQKESGEWSFNPHLASSLNSGARIRGLSPRKRGEEKGEEKKVSKIKKGEKEKKEKKEKKEEGEEEKKEGEKKEEKPKEKRTLLIPKTQSTLVEIFPVPFLVHLEWVRKSSCTLYFKDPFHSLPKYPEESLAVTFDETLGSPDRFLFSFFLFLFSLSLFLLFFFLFLFFHL